MLCFKTITKATNLFISVYIYTCCCSKPVKEYKSFSVVGQLLVLAFYSKEPEFLFSHHKFSTVHIN